MDLLIVLIALSFIITLYTLYSVIYKQNKLQPLELTENIHHYETSEELIEQDRVSKINFPPDPIKESVPDLPGGYADNKITIMARDPEWIYAYWDLNPSYTDSLRRSYQHPWEHSGYVLRVYELTDFDGFSYRGSSHCFDVKINEDANNWYFKIPHPDKVYCVELGRFFQDGTYVALLKSNPAYAPRNSISDKIDPAWMLVSDKERKLFASIGHRENMSSAALIKNGQDH